MNAGELFWSAVLVLAVMGAAYLIVKRDDRDDD